ncbi:MAG TPA: VRR-NUC domain-containing protein [Flavitalea sp.]|nr:VRR-NUC domain-containing protein [Flavitalea sp.]
MVRLLKSGELSEESIHKTIIQWVRNHPKLKKMGNLVMHFPNEGKRSLRYGKLMKDLGMRKGVSDLLIAMPRHGYGGAWIEIKSRGGIVSKEQNNFLSDMRQQNYFTAVCWSIDEGIKTIDWYCLN